MLELISLASGSEGNCTLVRSGSTVVVIDAGISQRDFLAHLLRLAIPIEYVAGLVLGHEHTDHSSGVGAISKLLNCPVYATQGTLDAVRWGRKEPAERHAIAAGAMLQICDLRITAFPIPHDAADPVAFTVRCNDTQASVVTDLGCITDEVLENIVDSDILLLESNYDRELLIAGHYPAELRVRIVNNHLSNKEACAVIECLDGRPRQMLLGHLSRHCNHPELVKIEAKKAIADRPIQLTVIRPGEGSGVIHV